MGTLAAVSVDSIFERGSITGGDVMRMRSAYYQDGAIDAAEAELLFRLNEACEVQDAAWADFFVEAIADFIVHQTKPEGYLTIENADWLIERIGRDGRVESRTELELLVHVLDKARWSPASLVSFALEQVRIAVVEGEGPLRQGRHMSKGSITEGEVDVLRRILYAFGGDGSVPVTRAEAEILFAINDAMPDAVNPAWAEFFSKAIANVLMASSGYAVPTREEAMRQEAWLERRGDLSPVGMLKAMVASGLSGVIGSYKEQTSEERALARLERQRIEIITNEEITEGEASWLAERLSRDGKLSPAEAALVAYLKKESPKIDPVLWAAIDRLTKVA